METREFFEIDDEARAVLVQRQIPHRDLANGHVEVDFPHEMEFKDSHDPYIPSTIQYDVEDGVTLIADFETMRLYVL